MIKEYDLSAFIAKLQGLDIPVGSQEDRQAQLWGWWRVWRLWPTSLTQENEAVSTFSVLPFVSPTPFQGSPCPFHMAWHGCSRSHLKTSRNRHIQIHARPISANAHRRLKNVLWTGSTARMHQNLKWVGNGWHSANGWHPQVTPMQTNLRKPGFHSSPLNTKNPPG